MNSNQTSVDHRGFPKAMLPSVRFPTIHFHPSLSRRHFVSIPPTCVAPGNPAHALLSLVCYAPRVNPLRDCLTYLLSSFSWPSTSNVSPTLFANLLLHVAFSRNPSRSFEHIEASQLSSHHTSCARFFVAASTLSLHLSPLTACHQQAVGTLGT